MNQPPQYFINFCNSSPTYKRIAHILWLDLWEKTINEFLVWLVKEVNLTEEQLNKLDRVFDEITEQKTQNKFILEYISPILTSEQNQIAIKKFAEIFTHNLYAFYIKIEDETKQIKLRKEIRNLYG